jgi:excinuclease ABC subunit A
VKPWQTESFKRMPDDLMRLRAKPPAFRPTCRGRDAVAKPIARWVLEGDPQRLERLLARSTWYGVKRFFDWLETKAYKMHIRVLLSRYRAYTPCAVRWSATEAGRLLWRAACAEAEHALVGRVAPRVAGPEAPGVPGTASPPAGTYQRFLPVGSAWRTRCPVCRCMT